MTSGLRRHAGSRSLSRHALLSLAARRGTLNPASLDDSRLPEAVYAAAIRGGAMDTINFASED